MKRLGRAVTVVLGMGLGTACCVARGTRVRTRSGERLVETLEVGDELISVDPVTSARVTTTLVAVRTSRRECLSLTVDDATLRCTTDHPLYDPDAKVYADAGDWALGRRKRLLVVPTDEAVATVAREVQAATAVTLADVFDLTVEHPLHNFVADGVLVHNKSPPGCLPDAGPGNATWCEGMTCAAGEVRVPVCNDRFTTCECIRTDGGTSADGGVDGGP